MKDALKLSYDDEEEIITNYNKQRTIKEEDLGPISEEAKNPSQGEDDDMVDVNEQIRI